MNNQTIKKLHKPTSEQANKQSSKRANEQANEQLEKELLPISAMMHSVSTGRINDILQNTKITNHLKKHKQTELPMAQTKNMRNLNQAHDRNGAPIS